MNLLDLTKKLKIDFTQTYIEFGGGNFLEHEFEISPKDFLTYSKEDLRTNSQKGNINALTNAKRAIDCQTDKILFILGLSGKCEEFPPAVKEFIYKATQNITTDNISLKLKLLQALNFSPTKLISEVRTLRNKLEHYYKKPTKKEVFNAIELAELFILATDNKLKPVSDFIITDKERRLEKKGGSLDISFDEEKHCFNIEILPTEGKYQYKKVKNIDIEFFYLFKLAINSDYKDDICRTVIDLLEAIKHPTPKEYINVSVFYI